MRHKAKRKTVAATPAAKKPAGKPSGNVLTIYCKPGDDPAKAIAQSYLRPAVQGASIVRAYSKYSEGDGPELNALVAELGKQAEAVNGGDLRRPEEMLITQAHSLDAISRNLFWRASRNFEEYLGAAETYMRLALKAQAQCTRTLEVLGTLKNPPTVFARQANIAAGPQQVNNGIPAGEGSRARETESARSKLLEAQNGERLDTSAAGTTSGADPQLAPVGKINRAENSGR